MRLTTVLLDFGGTLARERSSRAGLYAETAREHGLEVEERAMAELMMAAARALVGRDDVGFRYGQRWFEAFMEQIFVEGLALERGGLPPLREALFERFADPATFELLPGAHALLEDLRAAGLRLGLVSNWSPALPGLVQALGIAEAFETLLVSSLERLEKPDPRIFQRALERLDARPEEALHSGNDPQNDCHGPRAAGLRAILVHAPDEAGCPRAQDLRELRELILAQRT